MAWITEDQCVSLLKFLEVDPPVNNHQGLRIKHFSFYSSELKNLKQTFDLLQAANDIGWDDYETNDPKTKTRYANSLQNMGLLNQENEKLVLTPTAKALLKYLQDRKLISENLIDKDYVDDAIECERIILANLLNILKESNQKNKKAYDYAFEIFRRLQEFYEATSDHDFNSIVNNLKLLYFCQAINSSGFELKKYFKLPSEERLDLLNLWYHLAEDKENFPDVKPDSFLGNPFEKAVFIYTRSRAKNSLQLDVRVRCRNILNAYSILMDENKIPEISNDLHIINDRFVNKEESRVDLDIPTENKKIGLSHQLIVTGCPGSGKSTMLNEEVIKDGSSKVVRVSAHPEYSYSDLIGCYKPVPVYQKAEDVITINGDSFEKGLPRINYEFVIGPLIKQLILAIKNPSDNHILIIEEINRTDCNALFGDFFQLLDRDENGNSCYEIDVMPDLASILIEENLNQTIRLPSNLYIWGTMNAADQGVFSLDSAFRRRWEFIYKGYSEPCKYPSEDRLIRYGGENFDWEYFRGEVNAKLVSLGVHEDKMIGPYFLSVSELRNPQKVCNKLFLYLWEDVLRFQREELMNFSSFSDLVAEWSNGEGSPLEINLDRVSDDFL